MARVGEWLSHVNGDRAVANEMLHVFGRSFLEYFTVDEGQDQPVNQVPGLQVLSAIAICRQYKASAGLGNSVAGMGSTIVKWARCHVANCPVDTHMEHNRPTVCGFCGFSRWIKEQGLPQLLEGYVLNVLNYLAYHSEEFLDMHAIMDKEEEEEEGFLTLSEGENEDEEGEDEEDSEGEDGPEEN